MQSGALRALEFDRIVEAVQTFAVTPMGIARLAKLSPATDREEVAKRLAHTSETTRYLATGAGFLLRASDALADTLAAIDVEGRPLEPLRLLGLATFLDSVDETRASIRRAPDAFPRLAAVSDAAASFKHEAAAVRAAIDPSGEVVDHASPELAAIR
jgi:DNA mismatch repair protein MutS2